MRRGRWPAVMLSEGKAGVGPIRQGLRRRRKDLGPTQEPIAERMEIERSTVVRWERATRHVP